jgi:hypothetical protein
VTEPTSPEAGWYPDPAGGGDLRWWTGVAWTDDTLPHPWSSTATPTAPVPAFPVITSAPPATSVPAAYSSAAPGPGATPDPDPDPLAADPFAAAPDAADAGPPRRRRGRIWLFVGIVAVLVAAVAGVVVLLGSIAARSQLDMAAVEAQIATQLTDDTGVATTVDCPDSVAIAAGTTFTCTATAVDGQTSTVTVHQDDDQGNLTFGVPR